MHNAKVCPTCSGSKWVRGFVGGVYDCPDCWIFEQNNVVIEDNIIEMPKRKGRSKKGMENGRKEKTKD